MAKRYRVVYETDSIVTAKQMKRDMKNDWYGNIEEYLEPQLEGKWIAIG